MSARCQLAFLIFATALCPVTAPAQLPAGGIQGRVLDESGGLIPSATVAATDTDTGFVRSATTGRDGTYSIAMLAPGVYELTGEAEGFRTVKLTAVVMTGSTTTVDLHLTVGILEQIVEAIDYLPRMSFDKHVVDGVVSRFEIENLPLNGREFLQLAVLEPGVTTAPTSGLLTRQVDVSLLGASSARTRITIDGGPIHNPLIGGIPQNFSQEVVQEFQISSVNFDLSTGLTTAGAINVVTRSGGNEYHGSAFYFFRDHNLAAFPGLRREPANEDPFFARRQVGFQVGGPIQRDRIFFFTNFEDNNQDGVFTVQPTAADFANFGGIFPSPFDSSQLSVRFDVKLSERNMAFVRYSHDGNEGLTPPTGGGNLPSNWSKSTNWVDQSAVSLSTAFRPNVVNEARFSYWYWQTRNLPPTSMDCPGACPGLGMPEISILGTDLVMGNFILLPQGGDFRRYHTADNVSWQKGRHLMRFGFEWQFDRGSGFLTFVEPASMVLYPPDVVRAFNADPRLPAGARIPLPGSFETIDDILQLPLVGFSTGFGDPSVPPSFNFDEARGDHLWRFYWQDRWRVRPRFTLNYGLSYSYHLDPANHDLSKPRYLEPLLGAEGLAPTRRDANNFGPSLGFAWNVSKTNRTVIRAGAGVYYEQPLDSNWIRERTTIGPRGTGRFVVDGSIIPNPIPGLPTVPLGQPLNFVNGPTHFTGSLVLRILPEVRRFLQSQLGPPDNSDLSVRNIEVFKQGTGLLTRDYSSPYSVHFNAGVQQSLSTNLVLTSDFVYRRFVDQNMGDIDFNRWDSVDGPVIRPCSGGEILDPTAQCSTGPIGVQVSGARGRYVGLLTRLEKHWRQGLQFRLSYALSSNTGFNRIINNDNWFESHGPRDADRRHVLSASGIANLPWHLRIAFVSTVMSKPPFRAQLFGFDLNGDGTINDLLPGTAWNEFNRRLDESDLRRSVNEFNDSIAGQTTPRGRRIPRLTLPQKLELGDSLLSQDFRLSRIFKFRELYELNVFAEVFNLFNIANLSGHGFNLGESEAFAQPSRRVNQIFGSGGPRAFQLGVRFTF